MPLGAEGLPLETGASRASRLGLTGLLGIPVRGHGHPWCRRLPRKQGASQPSRYDPTGLLGIPARGHDRPLVPKAFHGNEELPSHLGVTRTASWATRMKGTVTLWYPWRFWVVACRRVVAYPQTALHLVAKGNTYDRYGGECIWVNTQCPGELSGSRYRSSASFPLPNGTGSPLFPPKDSGWPSP